MDAERREIERGITNLLADMNRSIVESESFLRTMQEPGPTAGAR